MNLNNNGVISCGIKKRRSGFFDIGAATMRLIKEIDSEAPCVSKAALLAQKLIALSDVCANPEFCSTAKELRCVLADLNYYILLLKEENKVLVDEISSFKKLQDKNLE
ncbi:MAG: hypothetical protein LBG79_08345 [Spirochaetaceae bacterium]|jgi:hypothetical protein|nr:hypothetical protein [Spirochaetaceae bacterium]GMO21037.1 MAG: hypothetical protein Pg6A_08020 [Termitinemataceae bacterium]